MSSKPSQPQPREKYCTFYIHQNDQSIPNHQDLQRQIESGKIEDRIKALKTLIICIMHDEFYPRMLMTIFNNLLPIQGESHSMKKVLLYYWEIIEKVNPNGVLKDEMILVCNSIRNDLLHPNEYIRGRTLKLLSRVMYKGILEPLTPSILENLTHKHTYVRRNAVSCLYNIYLNFKDELISDIDEHIQKLLLSETDLSTKRTAFLVLFNCNQEKALEYINENIIDDNSEEIGDILQLVVLEILRKTIKIDSSQKARLIKAIFYFSSSKSSSVLFECANTLIQISSSSTYLKHALNIFIQLLISNTDNNVKLIVLDKLAFIKQLNPKILEEQIPEITNALNNQSLAIRQKTLDLIKNFISSRNNKSILETLFKELNKVAQTTEESEIEYRNLLLSTFSEFISTFPNIIKELLNIIFDRLISFSKLDENSAAVIVTILKKIVALHEDLRENIISNIINRLNDIASIDLLKVSFWILGEYSHNQQIEESINSIKRAIGSLPLEDDKPNVEEESKKSEKKKEKQEKKPKYKTIILPDGTYGTEIVNENNNSSIENKNKDVEFKSVLRETLIKSTTLTCALTNCLMKLIYKLRENLLKFNKYGSESILIFCALLKLLKIGPHNKENSEIIERILVGIKLITKPNLFTNTKIGHLETADEITFTEKEISSNIEKEIYEEKDKHIAKQADDLIIIRQLKGKNISDVDLADDEINDLNLNTTDEEEDFTKRLAKIIQLTGYSDPIYAEAFMTIHKYDITFDILLVNRFNKPLQNVSVEFSTQGDLRVVEKPQQIILGPLQSAQIKTSIKLSSSEAGLIFASINFENSAGLTQMYMITNEILIDLIDFIYPANIELEKFRKFWSKYEWENRITVNTTLENPIEYIKTIAHGLKMHILEDYTKNNNSQNYYSVNCYAKTKLDDDFLANISVEKINNKLTGYIRIRSKIRGIVINLGERIKKIQRS